MMTDEAARIKAEARATLERLAGFPPKRVHDEDRLEHWSRLKPQPEPPKQERGLDTSLVAVVDGRIAAWLDAERQKQADVLAGMQAELGEALEGIASALGVIDARLRALEAQRTNKTGRESRPIALPDFLGPTCSERDRSVRYTQPRIQ
jgi:hypothetical protein